MIRHPPRSTLFPYTTLSDLGIASALAGGAMSKLFGGGQKAAKQFRQDRKSGSAGMPRPISYAVFCLKKKKETRGQLPAPPAAREDRHPARGARRAPAAVVRA